MALNKFSVLVSNVGTSGTVENTAKCFSPIPVAGSCEERRTENKPHFSSPGIGFTKEIVCNIGLGNERLLRDISAELLVPLITQKAWQMDVV